MNRRFYPLDRCWWRSPPSWVKAGQWKGRLFHKAAKGAAREQRLLMSSLVQQPTDWSRDGRFVLYAMLDPKTQWDLCYLPMKSDSPTDDRKPVSLMQADHNEHNGQFSPDGRSIAYQSDESGTWEVYLRGFPESAPGTWQQISTGGGVRLRWRPDGKERFYIDSNGNLMAVPMKPGTNVDASTPQALFKTRYIDWVPWETNYVPSRDGQRFLFKTFVDDGYVSPITVLLNWPAALRRDASR
jgi:eukaryotic-like serine/threonine-protein kinase